MNEVVQHTRSLHTHSLPAWTYRDPGFFELERERVFLRSWQLVCHRNDIPEPGDFFTLDLAGEPVFAVRDQQRRIRAFFNVCRHRASRLLDGPQGRCGRRIVCPYHAWSYALDGTLTGVTHRRDFEDFDPADHGLVPVETEEALGFVFVRILPGGPSVHELLEPYLEELTAYRFEEMQPLGRITLRPRPVNWKNVADNYVDAQHIRPAHPGLGSLVGDSYGVEVRGHMHKMWGRLEPTPDAGPSVRAYTKFLPEVEHLRPEQRRLWAYYRMWPNLAFDVYPDQVDFMQFLPISATETLIREIPYALPDTRREMRAARYLNWRINRVVNREDTALIQRVQDGMASASFTAGPLAASEVCLRDFATRMREAIPEACHPRKPHELGRAAGVGQ